MAFILGETKDLNMLPHCARFFALGRIAICLNYFILLERLHAADRGGVGWQWILSGIIAVKSA